MTEVEIVLGLVVLATVVASLANRLSAPAPSLLVLAGIVVGLLPGLPEVRANPDVISFVVLPPLLFAGASEVPQRDLRAVAGAVARLAIGLVAATAVVVAVVVHAVLPRLTLPVAFVLGAILASTDPVAVTALARRLRLPRRLNTLVQAESLLNDATSLVLFTVAVGVVVDGGGVSWPRAIGRFFLLAGGGAAIGFVLAWLSGQLRARTEDPLIETAIALLTPYVCFVVAQRLSVSGVTAVVVAGLAASARGPLVTSGTIRLQVHAVYAVVVFLLESVVFSVIGLELPRAIRDLPSSEDGVWLAALAVIVAVLGTRLLWLAASVALPALRGRSSPDRGWRAVAVMSWAGTRGVIPLTAALSIPLTVDSGAPFPHRDLLLVLTTTTIVVSLVVQGLTLGPVVRRLGVVADPQDEVTEEARARGQLATVALGRLRELLDLSEVDADLADRLRADLERRAERSRRVLAELDGGTGGGTGGGTAGQRAEDGSGPALRGPAASREARRQLLAVQSAELARLVDDGEIGRPVQDRLQHELDLDEARL